MGNGISEMLQIGKLKSFNSTDYRAEVQLAGSMAAYLDNIPVARNIASDQMTVGRHVILAIPQGNPKDACIIAVWDGAAGGGGLGGGVSAFLDLSDTPAAYTGQAGKYTRVNAGEDALEFAAGGGGGVTDHGDLTGLADDDHAQYLKEKASGGLAAEIPDHASNHEWLGDDELDVRGLLANAMTMVVDWQTIDQWTQENSGSGSQSIDIFMCDLKTGATNGSYARIRNTGGYIFYPRFGAIPTYYLYRISNRGTVQSVSTIWLGVFRNVSSPSDTAAHVAFKIINGRVYASCADGTTQTITDTGNTTFATAAYGKASLLVVATSTVIKYYIGTTLVATHTTNIPGAALGRIICHIENSAAVAQTIRVNTIRFVGDIA